MAHELTRPEEETVRRPARAVVDEMRAADPPEDPQREEPPHREPSVDEAVVNEHVAEPEERHPDARTDHESAWPAVELTAGDDEAGRHRRVEDRERVVLLEPTVTRLVMRPMHGPEPVMPHAAVEQARPELHPRRNGERGDDGRDHLEDRPARHEAPR